MKSKKIASLFLALCMAFSMGSMAFAESRSIAVTMTGTAIEEWTVNLPSTITLNGDAQMDVDVDGSWPSSKELVITVPQQVILKDGSNTITLSCRFVGSGIDEWVITGQDMGLISESDVLDIEVLDDIDLSEVFGTFTGTMNIVISLS